MTCAPGVHVHLWNRPPSEGLSVAEKGWREASPTSQSLCILTRPPGHSPLRTPPLAPPSSGGLLAASAASPTLKLPFRVRMTGDLVGPKARRRSRDGGHRVTVMLTPTAGGKLAPRAHARLYQVFVGMWGSKS